MIHVEGESPAIQNFVHALKENPPPMARINSVQEMETKVNGWTDFLIAESEEADQPSVEIPVDLAVCPECLQEMLTPTDRRFLYPYINCTNCGPRYTVIKKLPYDRAQTTMKEWTMCPACQEEYHNPFDRRFHAQPNACPVCGPHYVLYWKEGSVQDSVEAIKLAAQLLKQGEILAIKGLGGYHLACDAQNVQAVTRLRERKRRPAKPFAIMVKDMESARAIVDLTEEAEELLTQPSRPIVLAPARHTLLEVAPDNGHLGVMLPYTPLHHLLYHVGAPPVLVMTSANRSGEPIVYRDEEARLRLKEVCDAWLVGQRPIARRVDDSVCRPTVFGPMVIRRSRGMAPLPVANFPPSPPILAFGADLKNTVTLVVSGKAVMSQHLGDLEQYEAFEAFEQTVRDLLAMYRVEMGEIIAVSDRHPGYHSTQFAQELPVQKLVTVQHHKAHVASVLADREAWDRRVIGLAFDGTGYGDDGAIWGGECFVGSLREGLMRIAHLRPAVLPGGEAAAKVPVQALAGFLADRIHWAQEMGEKLHLPKRYFSAIKLVEKELHTYPTTSMGRLFDAVAALLGFFDEISFEGQAAMWLEYVASRAPLKKRYPFPWDGRKNELDYGPLLEAMVEDLLKGEEKGVVARAFHRSMAEGILEMAGDISEREEVDTVVLSGGVFQNNILLEDMKELLQEKGLDVWLPKRVPVNDGGLSLGQAALVAARYQGM